jgi:hypothetical protein
MQDRRGKLEEEAVQEARKQVGNGNLGSDENAPASAVSPAPARRRLIFTVFTRYSGAREYTNPVIPNRSLPCCCRGCVLLVHAVQKTELLAVLYRSCNCCMNSTTYCTPHPSGCMAGRRWEHMHVTASFRLGFTAGASSADGPRSRASHRRCTSTTTHKATRRSAWSVSFLPCSVQREPNAPDTVRPCGGVLVV